MLLVDAVDQVVMECDLEQSTTDQYYRAVRRFSAWLKGQATTEDLTEESVNKWLASMQPKLSGTTIRNYRVALTRVWGHVSKVEGIRLYDIRRIRKVKQYRKPVQAWSVDQFKKLLDAASRVQGKMRHGVQASDYLAAWLWVGFDTALRPSDLRLIEWDSIDMDKGTISIVQHKTGNPHTAMLSPNAVACLRKIKSMEDKVFPLTKGGMRRWELSLYAHAMMLGFSRKRGQGLGTLRKLHATEIYSSDGVYAAAESLGHVGGVRTVKDHYIDATVTRRGRLPPRPPF